MCSKYLRSTEKRGSSGGVEYVWSLKEERIFQRQGEIMSKDKKIGQPFFSANVMFA